MVGKNELYFRDEPHEIRVGSSDQLWATELGQSRKRRARGVLIRAKLAIVLLILDSSLAVLADDSAAAPALDMGALANLASSLGSNPQIMSLMSNFLNPGGQKPAVSAAATPSLGSIESDLGPGSDLGSNSIAQENLSTGNFRPSNEPLRRGLKPVDQSGTQTTASSASTAVVPSTPAANPLNGLMSMLPGVLSGLSSGNSGLNGLTGLLGLNKATPPATTSAIATPEQAGPTSAATLVPAAPTTTVQTPVAPGPSPAGPAQSVINQVLTAYASGQIPNELIQLGLSGRVPPQIIELALSGQVPPQIIQMVITGQVPMSTINSFLSTMQQTSSNAPRSETNGNSNGGATRAPAPGVFATTRAIFEALFGIRRAGQTSDGRSGLTVQTILGPVALRMPSMPNMRSIGQLVGGTITNISSMIPF